MSADLLRRAAEALVRAVAERNVDRSPGFYGATPGPGAADRREWAVVREARRLAESFNRGWMHHLSQHDVNILIAADRLVDFTHTFVRGQGWLPIVPTPVVTAREVNLWSLSGMGHGSGGLGTLVAAYCAADGVSTECPVCAGHGSLEAYPGQRAEADAWEATEPPAGDGWQLWETVSEGSPISPVFASAEALAGWLADPDREKPKRGPDWFEHVMASLGGLPAQERAPRDWMPYDAALKFVRAGWAPSAVGMPGAGVVPGAEFVGFHQQEGAGGDG